MELTLNDILEYGLKIITINKSSESSVGNVYILEGDNCKYILKLYDDINDALIMISLHNYLYGHNFIVPSIIKTVDNKSYIEINNKIAIIYSFLEGEQLYKLFDVIPNYIVERIALELRRFHDVFSENECSLNTIYFDDFGLKRKSILHFDLTKSNIFYNKEVDKIGFIDLDDAKYGISLYDVAIIISLLFISKKRGINYEGIKIFLKNYYSDENEYKLESKFIKKAAIIWIDYTLLHNDFNSSIKESFEVKKQLLLMEENLWN